MSDAMNVYVLTNVIRSAWQHERIVAWQHERIVVGVYATRQAADKQVQEDTDDGFEVSAYKIEEYEVKQ